MEYFDQVRQMTKPVIAIDPRTATPARYWHSTHDGRVQCDLCPRRCRLKEGQRGACFIRGRLDDAMVLTTYGRSTGFCVDPIEKKPLYHFLPGTPVLSFGTAGCNLACKFCQNWDTNTSREIDVLTDRATPEMIAHTAKRLGCRSVAFTYNDPIIFLEYAVDVARACHEVGLKTVAVTAGYVCDEARAEFFAHMDAANVDLKAFTDRFYKYLCAASLQPVLDTLAYLHDKTSIWTELTTLLIPGENDSPGEIEELCTWIVEHLGPEVPMHFSAFHPAYRMTDVPSTPPQTLRMACEVARNVGIQHVFTGNIHDNSGSASFCPQCGRKVIGRDWYMLTEWNLSETGNCCFCDASCSGVFDGPPGTWGGRRLPVRLDAVN